MEEGNKRRFEGENRAMMRDEEQREDANAFLDLLCDRSNGRETNIHSNLNFRLGVFLAERLELVCECLAIGLERGPEIYSE